VKGRLGEPQALPGGLHVAVVLFQTRQDQLALEGLHRVAQPPTPEDLAGAIAVCRELSLGDLLDRMPSSLQQIVGESGWQLSHGERSRLFMARVLLQKAGVVILDENFVAGAGLLVIAHP
jgi:ATPase subunit of ABC transporter with duplicated ATPase domains